MANTYLTRTFGTATNRLKGTFSFWVKRSAIGSSATNMIFNSWNNANYRFQIYFQGGTNADRLALYNVDNSSANMYFETNAKYRDVNAWYHIYIAVDTTLSTQGDRLKFYVNGERITSFAQETYPAQNADMSLGASSYTNLIGQYGGGGGEFDGSMSHYYFVDGSVIDVGQFGSTDSTTGEWKINTSPTISSYGNQGFLILKDGNTITDQSPNSNNFTLGSGTLSNTEDNPSNVFATLNPLDGYTSHMVFSHGNNSVDNGSTATNKSYTRSTLGMTSGKFYFEAKNVTNANYQTIGITDKASGGTDGELGGSSADYVYRNADGQKGNNNSFSSYGNTYTTNDIIGVAVDLDNLKIYFSKNGVWQNSGDPTSGATGTGAAFTITAPSSTSTGFYFFAVGDTTQANSSKWSANFGNGYFGTTAVSSAGTNASNNGIFEYDVPSGYTALSTKGLNI